MFRPSGKEIRSLSKERLFAMRTSTRSEAFSPLICLDATKFVLPSVFTLIDTICPKIWARSLHKKAKRPLPVDGRRSKTPLLNLPFILVITKDDNSFSFYTLSEPFTVHSIPPKLCSKIVKLKPREPPFWIVRCSLASRRDVISSIVICYQAIAHFRFSETLNFKTRLSVLNLSGENEFYCIAGE